MTIKQRTKDFNAKAQEAQKLKNKILSLEVCYEITSKSWVELKEENKKLKQLIKQQNK
jgi:hypothetical protein